MIRRLLYPACLLAATLAGGATVAEIAAQPQLWPAEVRLTAAAQAAVLRDNHVTGTMLIGAG
ncbi:MAG: hypothetical protein ACHQ5A_05025, partial [Opitutales bacterium]